MALADTGEEKASAEFIRDTYPKLAKASRNQSIGIDQINKAIFEMDTVTQQNAAGAEESASAAEELNARAEQMKSRGLRLYGEDGID